MSYTLNKAPLDGFVVLLPFGLNARAQLCLRAHRAVLLAHLRLSPSDQAAFPSYSDTLTQNGDVDWSIANDSGSEVIKLSQFRPEAVFSSQTVGAGDSILQLEGQNSIATRIEFTALPSESFPEFNAPGRDRFNWGGILRQGGRSAQDILKVSECFVDFDFVFGAVRRFVAAGPVRAGIGQSAFEWLVSQGKWLREVKDGQGREKVTEHPSDSPVPEVTLTDLRRDRSLTFFGIDEVGKGQAAQAMGAVFFACGSFVRDRSVLQLQRLAMAAYGEPSKEGDSAMDGTRADQIHAASLACLSVPRLEDSTGDGGPPASHEDILFEGMTVWGLKPRKSGDTAETVRPLLL